MSDPRMLGVTLMALACAAFVGSSSEVLPSVTFFPALAVFVLGAIKFLRSNRVALEAAENRAQRIRNPVMRENRQTAALAENQARHAGRGHEGIARGQAEGMKVRQPQPAGLDRAIEIDDPSEEFVVTTDVSFPVEVQSGDALADQLRKLNQLLEQGVLTEEEYAVAKAKILG